MRILVAEDSPQDLMLLREAFASAGIDATMDVVEDGIALSNRLAASRLSEIYDIAVLDATLPRKASIDVLRQTVAALGALPIPVVILSSLLAPAQHLDFRSVGVADVLRKPLEFDGYAAVIERLKTLVAGASRSGFSSSRPPAL